MDRDQLDGHYCRPSELHGTKTEGPRPSCMAGRGGDYQNVQVLKYPRMLTILLPAYCRVVKPRMQAGRGIIRDQHTVDAVRRALHTASSQDEPIYRTCLPMVASLVETDSNPDTVLPTARANLVVVISARWSRERGSSRSRRGMMPDGGTGL